MGTDTYALLTQPRAALWRDVSLKTGNEVLENDSPPGYIPDAVERRRSPTLTGVSHSPGFPACRVKARKLLSGAPFPELRLSACSDSIIQLAWDVLASVVTTRPSACPQSGG
eukprot:8570780-Pyramimonas_sp.AAC.1